MSLKDQIPLGARVLLEDSTSSENGEWVVWSGGTGSYQAFGTFGGTDSVKLQGSLDGGTTATDIAGASWSSASVGEFTAGSCLIRAVTTITGTSSISVVVSEDVENG